MARTVGFSVSIVGGVVRLQLKLVAFYTKLFIVASGTDINPKKATDECDQGFKSNGKISSPKEKTGR
jgi:hypothetical protein